MREDYYELLELSQDASAQEVKASYRRMALRFHPDRNEGNAAAEERFKLVAEAYRVLGEPERRADYDAWLARAQLARKLPPELASMPRHVHLSRRSTAERRESRGARRAPRRVNTRVVFRRRSRFHTYVFMGMYAMVLFTLLPMFFRGCDVAPSAPAKSRASSAKAETGAAVWAGVQKMERELRGRAASGDAGEQYKLGFYLLNKSYLGHEEASSGLIRRAAAAAYLREAHEWLQKSAAQGNKRAQRLLQSALRQQR